MIDNLTLKEFLLLEHKYFDLKGIMPTRCVISYCDLANILLGLSEFPDIPKNPKHVKSLYGIDIEIGNKYQTIEFIND